MLPAEAERLLTADLVEWLADLVDPALLRRESPKAQREGLSAAVVHRIGVNEAFGLLHFRDELEHNPLPLRDPDGLRLVLVTSRGEDLAVDDVEFADWSRDDDCLRCRTALESWEPPPFVPTSRITSVGALHIAYDHANRAGMTPERVLDRLRPAVAEANAALGSWVSTGSTTDGAGTTTGATSSVTDGAGTTDPSSGAPISAASSSRAVVGAYWHPATETWAQVIPLRLDPKGEPVAGVLTKHPDGYHLVTILTRRTAFWNLVSVGQVPPSWLDGSVVDTADVPTESA